MASAAYASADPIYYYRHTKNVFLTVPSGPTDPETPEEPGTSNLFIARNIGGDSDSIILAADEPHVSISLFDPTSGNPFYGAQSWQLLSGALPQGITAQLSDDKQTMRFTGVATQAGDFGNIVYRIKDQAGNSVLTKPLSFKVIDSGLIPGVGFLAQLHGH